MLAPDYADVQAAAARLTGITRPLGVITGDHDLVPGAVVSLGLEFMQHTGSFKARGAVNLLGALREARRVPPAGIVASTGRNADLGFAWAAAWFEIPVTVFLADTARADTVARLHGYGAEVRLGGATQAEAAGFAREFAARTGALDAYTCDAVLSAAGAGTILLDFAAAVPDLDTVVVAVGAGGMFSGIAAAADHLGIRVVGAEPVGSQALHAAVRADSVQNVAIDSVAADSLGAVRICPAALAWARAADVVSVVVDDASIVDTRRLLWQDYRVVVEHGAATGLAALRAGAYRARPGERLGIVLCGANSDPGDLTGGATSRACG
ncbi:pyridoxal-phosphate dependent enzyme [Nocardia sp. NPDC048505]|uniref:pyridoxal-phosphate dependent enzyme n=1 Tax=unclassified Nocardia TaxID=2637762 RepID=UPI0033CE0A15